MRCSTKIPDTLHGALTLCDQQLLPNVHHLLQLGCVLPVTSCEAYRSFSAFRRVKTVFHSCMGEERLSSLCLMHIHYDVQINSRAVVAGMLHPLQFLHVSFRFLFLVQRRHFSSFYPSLLHPSFSLARAGVVLVDVV